MFLLVNDKEKALLVSLYFSTNPTSKRAIKREFSKKFGNKDFDLKDVRRWARQFQESGSVKKNRPP